MQFWQPCLMFFAKKQQFFAQCPTILLKSKKFLFWMKELYFKIFFCTRRVLFQQLGRKNFAKNLISFRSKYENEHQNKYLFEIIQFLQQKFSWTRRKQFKKPCRKSFRQKKRSVFAWKPEKTIILHCFKKLFWI